MAKAIRAFAAAALLASAGSAAAQNALDASQGSWDMPTPSDEAVFQTSNDRQFAEDVRRATGGALDIQVHPAGKLFRHDEIADTVTRGLVPIGGFLLSRLAAENAIFGVDSLPYLTQDLGDARRLWQASRPAIEALLADRNLSLLYAVPWPGQSLFLTSNVADPAELEGLTLGTYNPPTRRLAEMLGMTAIQVETGGISSAFATGRIQAMIASPTTGVSSRAWEGSPIMINLRAWFPKSVVVVNTEVLSTLPEDQRRALFDAATAAEERGWQMSADETKARIATLEENGVNVTEPSDAVLKAMTEAGRIILEEWMEETGAVGADILAAYGR